MPQDHNERNETGLAEPELIFSSPTYEVFAVYTRDIDDIVDLTRRTRRYLNTRRSRSDPPFGVAAGLLERAPAGPEGGGQ